MPKSFTVNKNGFKPFANDGCQSLLQSTSRGSPIANGGCQSLLQSTSKGSPFAIKVDVKVFYSQQEWVHPFANGGPWMCWMSKSTTVSENGFSSHPLLMVNVKVYYSQQKWVHTLR